MSKSQKKQLAKNYFELFSILLFINGIIAIVLGSLNLGVILMMAFAILFYIFGFESKILNTRPAKVLKSLVFAIFILLMAYSIFVYAYGSNDNVTYDEDAVIVLGTTVNGDQPSKDLKNRLDAAIEYHEQNPDAYIIVTGGQGTEENDTEASVMATYLVNARLPEEKVIKEDRATSTVENFEYSAMILDKLHLSHGDAQIAYITNDFHIFRAGILAKNAGLDRITHYHGDTPWYMVVPNGIRESVVTVKMWLID